jgi:hypothetical protein
MSSIIAGVTFGGCSTLLDIKSKGS